jgi:hypothetical protein
MSLPRLRVISLGAGVQSTTLALMAAAGEIGPMPDCAIFADTGWEPRAVYEHLDRLEKALPFPVHRVSAGNIRDDIVRNKNSTGQRFASVPWFTKNGGLARRQCTREYKVEPLEKKQRGLLGYAPRKRIPPNSAEIWIGISMDEAIRMKPARNGWQTNRWPLIERQISRRDCQEWLKAHGWEAPKSACVGCPFHNDAQWRELRNRYPEEWDDAVKVDVALRNGGSANGFRHQLFMHRSLVPLSQVDLRTHAELGQPDLFLNECEGMCGT